MKLLTFLAGIFAASLVCYGQQQGTPKNQIVTQTSGTSTTAGGTAGGVSSQTGVGTAVTPTTGITTGTATPLTAVPTQTAGTAVGGTNASGATLPVLQNTTNMFGQIVGTTTNFQATTGTGVGSGVSTTGGGVVGQQTIQSTAPGFTQINLTLQGTVQSEADHQAILNRFQGLQGFNVIDQIQVAGQGGTGINEAAGATTAAPPATGTQP